MRDEDYFVEAYLASPREVLKPTDPIAKLEDGTYDDNLHPFLVVGDLKDKKSAVAFRMTSKREGLIDEYESFAYYELKADDNIRYSKSTNSYNSFVSVSQFDIISYKDLFNCIKRYAVVDKQVIEDIISQYLLLMETDMAVCESTFSPDNSLKILFNGRSSIPTEFLDSYSHINRVVDFKKLCYFLYGVNDDLAIIKRLKSNRKYRELREKLSDEGTLESFERHKKDIYYSVNMGIRDSYKEYNPLFIFLEDPDFNLVYGFRMKLYDTELSYDANKTLNYVIPDNVNLTTEKKDLSSYRAIRVSQLVVCAYEDVVKRNDLVIISASENLNLVYDFLSKHLFLEDNNLGLRPDLEYDHSTSNYDLNDPYVWLDRMLSLLDKNMTRSDLEKFPAYQDGLLRGVKDQTRSNIYRKFGTSIYTSDNHDLEDRNDRSR